jgi:hypothetical protein
MPKLSEVCRHVRSKNAGPFWITIDLTFNDRAAFDAFASSPRLQPASVATLFDVKASLIKRFPIEDLLVLKLSYPRRVPQGGSNERDMHGGQQYVRLLDLQL